MKTSHKILRPLLQAARERVDRGAPPVRVIFDLDSTLFCVSPRSQSILLQLSLDPKFRARFGEFAKALSQIAVRPEDWGIRAAVERLNVPVGEDLINLLRNEWAKAFFSSQHLHHDVPYPGALEFTQELSRAGAEIFYLTGRDRPNMGHGTVTQLKTLGFPLVNEGRLVMKPDSRRHDAEFKREAMESIFNPQSEVWYFENEPVILDLMIQHFPDIKYVFMDSVHSGRSSSPLHLPTLKMAYEW